MKDDYRLIMPDLRGHGQSEATAEASMGQYADDLAALLDTLGQREPVVLVGLSMGGYVAFEFYRRYPARVHALVLADTRASADSEEARAGRYRSAEKALHEGSQAIADEMLPKLFAPDAPEALREEWRAIMAAMPPEGVAAALRAMAERADSTGDLRTINRPVLVIVGREDRITPVADAAAMAEEIAGAELETIPDAGHLSPVEQPARFVAVLEQFLDDLDPVDQQGWPKVPDADQ